MPHGGRVVAQRVAVAVRVAYGRPEVLAALVDQFLPLLFAVAGALLVVEGVGEHADREEQLIDFRRVADLVERLGGHLQPVEEPDAPVLELVAGLGRLVVEDELGVFPSLERGDLLQVEALHQLVPFGRAGAGVGPGFDAEGPGEPVFGRDRFRRAGHAAEEPLQHVERHGLPAERVVALEKGFEPVELLARERAVCGVFCCHALASLR